MREISKAAEDKKELNKSIKSKIWQEIYPIAVSAGYEAKSLDLLLRELTADDFFNFVGYNYFRSRQVRNAAGAKVEDINTLSDVMMWTEEIIENFYYPLPKFEGRK